jgi:hypothetical protein
MARFPDKIGEGPTALASSTSVLKMDSIRPEAGIDRFTINIRLPIPYTY